MKLCKSEFLTLKLTLCFLRVCTTSFLGCTTTAYEQQERASCLGCHPSLQYKTGDNWVQMKRRLSGTNLSSENNLPTFRLNAPVLIRAHSVEKSASYFPSSSWYQITFSSFMQKPTEKPLKNWVQVATCSDIRGGRTRSRDDDY